MFLVVLYTFHLYLIAFHINNSKKTTIIENKMLYFLDRIHTTSYQSASKLRSSTLVKLRIKSLTISYCSYSRALNVFWCPTLSFFPLHTPNYETNLSLYTYVTNNLTMHSLVGRTLVGSKNVSICVII